MFRAARTFRNWLESSSMVNSAAVSLAESLDNELSRHRRNERIAASKAPIDDNRAMPDTHNGMNVKDVIADLRRHWG